MTISSLFAKAETKLQTLNLPERYAKEVREICEDLTKNTQYKDVKVKVIDGTHAQITGTATNAKITTNLDFENWTQHQVEEGRSHVLNIIDSVREFIQDIRGTIDGVPKIARTTRFRKNEVGPEFNLKQEDYENFVSGNKFRREETKDGKVTFFRNIDGDWVEMFPNKSK